MAEKLVACFCYVAVLSCFEEQSCTAMTAVEACLVGHDFRGQPHPPLLAWELRSLQLCYTKLWAP
jgi:hypothetical protein